MSEIVWPHVPRHRAAPKCDRCGRPLCGGCAVCEDDEYEAARETAEAREQRIQGAWE